jgi:beta-lactamase class A
MEIGNMLGRKKKQKTLNPYYKQSGSGEGSIYLHDSKKFRGISSGMLIILLSLVVLIVGTTCMYVYVTFTIRQQHRVTASTPMGSTSIVEQTTPTNGVDQWVADDKTTTPTSTFSLSDVKNIAVSPLFDQYYQRHGADDYLGPPLTVAFPVKQGWLQFFRSAALLAPTKQLSGNSNDALSDLIKKGVRDPKTGIVSLPLLQSLLTTGSLAPIVDGEGSITYVDLRKATDPTLMSTNTTSRSSNWQDVFVQDGIRDGQSVGHFVAQQFWTYINRSDISPDGWLQDFGPPLTDALSVPIIMDGSTHHLLVQAFARNALFLDNDAPDSSGQLIVQPLATGVDYLSTLGLPEVATNVQQNVWSQGDAPLFDTPGTGNEIAHIGQNFQLNLLPDSKWVSEKLWYHVQWSSSKTVSAWVDATAVTFNSPGAVTGSASFDALSPDLSNYLNSVGSNVSAAIYDITRQRYYSYNTGTSFIVASSMKVPIMLTFFDMIEQQNRDPDDDEMDLLTTMIENSNNDSASELYYNRINGAQGVTDYMQKIGVSGLQPDSDAWGYSQITAQTMVSLLTLLYEGKILNDHHRSIALNLMQNVESDQQVGVGDTAPPNSTVSMKDGWVSDDNNLWAVNSSGIVTHDKETYIISVYTQGQSSLDDGQSIVRQVCSLAAAALT